VSINPGVRDRFYNAPVRARVLQICDDVATHHEHEGTRACAVGIRAWLLANPGWTVSAKQFAWAARHVRLCFRCGNPAIHVVTLNGYCPAHVQDMASANQRRIDNRQQRSRERSDGQKESTDRILTMIDKRNERAGRKRLF
jgi:hypothetical protein